MDLAHRLPAKSTRDAVGEADDDVVSRHRKKNFTSSRKKIQGDLSHSTQVEKLRREIGHRKW